MPQAISDRRTVTLTFGFTDHTGKTHLEAEVRPMTGKDEYKVGLSKAYTKRPTDAVYELLMLGLCVLRIGGHQPVTVEDIETLHPDDLGLLKRTIEALTYSPPPEPAPAPKPPPKPAPPPQAARGARSTTQGLPGAARRAAGRAAPPARTTSQTVPTAAPAPGPARARPARAASTTSTTVPPAPSAAPAAARPARAASTTSTTVPPAPAPAPQGDSATASAPRPKPPGPPRRRRAAVSQALPVIKPGASAGEGEGDDGSA